MSTYMLYILLMVSSVLLTS